MYTITWRPIWRVPPNVEETVRAAVHATAIEAAARLGASDVPAAQDAVNTALGCLPRRAPNYCLLDVYASLGLPNAAQELLAQRAADEQRIRRLRFLKENLYDHPDLVVLDQLEHHGPGALGNEHVAELQRLARLIRSCDRWWFPLLEQWEQVGLGFTDVEKRQQAMLVLSDSLKALNGGSLPSSIAPVDTPGPVGASRRAHP
ncbi:MULTISPECIES: hypothetical protein [Streptomyces]|uniref:Uncharacterized protein n=1 Tax=Streptomyces scabiei TaxID=1930 RepID=A0A117EH60_STRSC|nr:hypothetical protein [Streptomyces scabiei]GAQ68255.1 hypothetical protein SsS58_08714 [Streptomyces scabiei]